MKNVYNDSKGWQEDSVEGCYSQLMTIQCYLVKNKEIKLDEQVINNFEMLKDQVLNQKVLGSLGSYLEALEVF